MSDEWERTGRDKESLDPWEGGERPEQPDPLPSLSLVQTKRFWMVRYTSLNASFQIDGEKYAETRGMNANESRVFLEEELTLLVGIMKRFRVHDPRDCYFVFPMDRHKE